MADARIVRTPAAEDDAITIWCEIAADDPAAADRFLDEIDTRIRRLANFPDMGSRRPDIAPEARMLVIGRYLVLYRHRRETVEVVRIVHGARDLTNLL